MRIKKILVEKEVQEKIFKKHNVNRDDIESVFFDEPIFYRTRDNRYMAIGDNNITIIFAYEKGTAKVITAYFASKWQKRLYKVKKCRK